MDAELNKKMGQYAAGVFQSANQGKTGEQSGSKKPTKGKKKKSTAAGKGKEKEKTETSQKAYPPKEKIKMTNEMVIWLLVYENNEQNALERMKKYPEFDPNYKCPLPNASFCTMLHLAVNFNLVSVVKHLLSLSNIDVNVTDFYGMTPLIYRSDRGWCESCDLLLEREDLNLDLEDKGLLSAPMHYCGHGDVKGVTAMIQSKKPINLRADFLNHESFFKIPKEDKQRPEALEKRVVECVEILKEFHNSKVAAAAAVATTAATAASETVGSTIEEAVTDITTDIVIESFEIVTEAMACDSPSPMKEEQ